MGIGLSKIEQFLISTYVLALFVLLFFFKGVEVVEYIPTLLLLALSFYWLYKYKNEWKLVLIVLLYVLSSIVDITYDEYSKSFLLSFWFGLVGVSAYFFYKHCKAYKSLEMMEGLLVLFNVSISASFLVDLGDQSNLLFFGLAYVVFTMIYNDNIWERFTHAENRLFILMLLVSFKYILTYVITSLL
jgi:hypothetical protein